MDNVLMIGRGEIALSEREMLMLATIEPLLKKARLSLHCPRCFELGLSDGGLRGNNAEGDRKWTIECNCSVRLAANPLTNAHSV